MNTNNEQGYLQFSLCILEIINFKFWHLVVVAIISLLLGSLFSSK